MTDCVYPGVELDALAYARRYYRWLLSYFRPYLGPRMIEVGPGIGTFSDLLLREPVLQQLVLIEPAANLVPVLSNRFAGDNRVRVLHDYLETCGLEAVADAVVCINVLEHVEDDNRFLRAAARALVPGGRLLLFVPALPWLYGSLDEAFLHYRRYTRRGLLLLLEACDLEPAFVRYMNVFGVLTWALAGRVLRRRTLRRIDVLTYDMLVVPWLSRVERWMSPPVGQSIVAVARSI